MASASPGLNSTREGSERYQNVNRSKYNEDDDFETHVDARSHKRGAASPLSPVSNKGLSTQMRVLVSCSRDPGSKVLIQQKISVLPSIQNPNEREDTNDFMKTIT